MYNAVDIAVALLKIAADKGKTLTQMQLQKLVYVAHGMSLAARNLPMIKQQVNAWQYGPVIPDIYHRFKAYGSLAIPVADLPENQQSLKLDQESVEILTEVVDSLADYSGGQLSELSHRAGSPWHKVWFDAKGREVRGAIIADEVIKQHYRQSLQSGGFACL